jgi:hypothetical protein
MEKQTKNIITRKWVEKELRFYNTANIRSALVFCGTFSLLSVPLTILIVYAACTVFENIVLKIALSIFMGAFTSAPTWIYLLLTFYLLSERKLLNRGEFDIVTRELLYKNEKMVHRHLEEFLHFQDFKEISVGHTSFQLALQGDTYYIVHYKTKKSIKLLYSAKMYEYHDKTERII